MQRSTEPGNLIGGEYSSHHSSAAAESSPLTDEKFGSDHDPVPNPVSDPAPPYEELMHTPMGVFEDRDQSYSVGGYQSRDGQTRIWMCKTSYFMGEKRMLAMDVVDFAVGDEPSYRLVIGFSESRRDIYEACVAAGEMLTRDRVQGLQLIEEIGTKFCKDIVSAMASSRQLGIFQAGKEMFKQLIPSWRKSLGTLRDMIDEALKDEQPKKPRKSERKSLKTRMQESFARQRRQSSSLARRFREIPLFRSFSNHLPFGEQATDIDRATFSQGSLDDAVSEKSIGKWFLRGDNKQTIQIFVDGCLHERTAPK